MTPIDFGDVCLNYDKDYFGKHELPPPTSLEALTKPEYKDLTVVENPATSSPGLAFMLGTIDHFGEEGWLGYWKQLEANGVEVASSWDEAYYTDFSGSSGKGPKPIVVSYASSPPAEVIFAETPLTEAPTAVVESTCFRQVEFAGVLAGTKHDAAAQRFIDFMVGTTFQNDMPLNMFVYPVNTKAVLPGRVREVLRRARQAVVTAPRRDREEPRRVDQRVDFDRARLTRIAARAALLALPLAFLIVFFVWPVATIIGKGVGAEGFREVFTDERLRGIAWFTLWQATVSTLLTLAIALPGAYVLSRYRFFGRSTVRALVTVPFVLPTVVVGAAFSRILPHRFDHTVWAILIAHVFFNYAVVVRVVGGLWANLDPRLAESASVLGAPRWRSMLEIDLPLLAPAIAAAGAIVFLFTFTSFGVVLLLGGPRHSTLEVEIYRQTAQLLDLQVAAALALVQLVAVVALLLVTTRMQSRLAVQRRMRRRDETSTTVRTRGQRALLGVNFAVMLVLLGLPLLALVERSFAVPGGHGLTWYRQLGSTGTSGLFVPPTEAIRNSLVFAANRNGDRHRDRRTGVDRDRRTPCAHLVGRRAHAAPRSVRGHDRLRVPHHARPAAARPAREADLDPDRAGTRRPPLRRALGRARPPVDRRSPARGRGSARRVAEPHLARDRLALGVAGARRRRGLRVRDLARRVRRDRVHRSSRYADSSDRDLPLARPPRRVELWPGDGDGDDPHGAHGGVRARVRARSPRRPRGVLSARRATRSRAVR